MKRGNEFSPPQPTASHPESRIPNPGSKGFTLIELIVTLVLLSVAVAALAGLVATLVGSSADPVIHTQAIYIAEGYLEEASLKDYSDPDGLDEGCPASRSDWDDIGNYGTCAAITTASVPSDPQGNNLPGLSNYRVSMSVDPEVTTFGPPTRRIEVHVTHNSGGVDLRMATLRAQY